MAVHISDDIETLPFQAPKAERVKGKKADAHLTLNGIQEARERLPGVEFAKLVPAINNESSVRLTDGLKDKIYAEVIAKAASLSTTKKSVKAGRAVITIGDGAKQGEVTVSFNWSGRKDKSSKIHTANSIVTAFRGAMAEASKHKRGATQSKVKTNASAHVARADRDNLFTAKIEQDPADVFDDAVTTAGIPEEPTPVATNVTLPGREELLGKWMSGTAVDKLATADA